MASPCREWAVSAILKLVNVKESCSPARGRAPKCASLSNMARYCGDVSRDSNLICEILCEDSGSENDSTDEWDPEDLIYDTDGKLLYILL